MDIHKRGWWERLWVVQEVALATGLVHLQCGDSICEYKRFCRIILYMTQQFGPDNTALQRAAAAATTLVEVASSYGYPDDPFSTEPAASWLVDTLYKPDAAKKRTRQFRDQKLATRLQDILLKTSGHFKCRDIQDRVLGHDKTRLAILWVPIWFTRLFSASLIWEQLYVLVARSWPIFRPQFVIMDHKEVHQAISGWSGDGDSQAQFFTGLAQYLATETGRLSILDGAGCMADRSSQVPSWTPVWTRTIDKKAHDFAISRDYAPPDKFHFSKNAKTLTLQGRPRGTINVVRAINTTPAGHAGPLQRAFETWLFLPLDMKIRMLAHLSFLMLFFGKIPATKRTATMKLVTMMEPIRRIIKNSDGHFLIGIWPQAKTCVEMIAFVLKLCIPQKNLAFDRLAELWIILDKATEILKRRSQTTLLYSFDARAGELGTLKAGEAVPGDQLVFVPGCYHHLVLRRVVNRPENMQWQLVGLVAMGPECGLDRTACTKDQWEQYERDGALQTYTIA
ncbi:hypothetical protein QC764_0097910 [Podospora pseudoanserina]|uniref:Heterokaryon incompatibility domain-containing protein n=1 Tax=Podospora pseudoanserina TaxID=2609844 RepID=A0ABR0HUZ0_9PEZI|nr:hypothetical protein QC764_0097910 [Podospora pseudoanserina]